MTTSVMIGIIFLAVFLFLLFWGLPVAVTMMVCGVLGSMFLLRTPFSAFNFLSTSVVNTFTSYSMCVAPMFMLMGELASESGIGRDMFDSLQKIMGRSKGGLASATQVGCALFGALNGSASATAALMCRAAYPQMKRYNYSDLLSTGCIAAGASLTSLIPPSVFLITYGITVEESIGKLFMGGILTGVVLMILFILIIRIWCLVNPTIAPKGAKTTLREKFMAIREGNFLEILIIFGLSMGGMFAGWFTPSEGGAVGVAGMLLVIIYLRRFSFKILMKAAENTLEVCGMMYCVLASAMVLGRFFTLTHIPNALGNLVSYFDVSSLLVIFIITVIYLVLGCFVDALPLMLLTVPIFLPIIRQIGYDPVWFGCYVVVIMGLAAITPPVGISCYIVSGICEDVPLTIVFKGSMPFIVAFIIMAMLMALFPGIATYLPSLMYK